MLYHLTEIENDLARSTFWSSYDKPDPRELISGELVSYTASSGMAKLRYRNDPTRGRKAGAPAPKGDAGKSAKVYDFSDFTPSGEPPGEMRMHPLVFDGPHTIEIRGESYPGLQEKTEPPTLFVCADWTESWVITCGFPSRSSGGKVEWLPARIFHVQGSEVTQVAESGLSPSEGRPFDIEVEVSSSTVKVSFSGKEVMAVKRPDPGWGHFGYRSFPALSEILVSGKIQPAWLQGVADDAIQEDWAAFEEHYDARQDLPAWLKERASAGANAPAAAADFLPGVQTPETGAHLRRFDQLLQAQHAEEALAYAQALPEDEIGVELRAWLSVEACMALDRRAKAAESCRTVCELAPHFYPARRLGAQLARELDAHAVGLERSRQLLTSAARGRRRRLRRRSRRRAWRGWRGSSWSTCGCWSEGGVTWVACARARWGPRTVRDR